MTTEITLWNGETVPRIGIGTWAIGGVSYRGGAPANYGEVDDARSLRGLALAYEMGARVFDTAAAYGAGNAELLLGKALAKKSDAVFVTKCGYFGDPATRHMAPEDASPAAVRASAENSRKRLGRDRIDLLLLHINMLPVEDARAAFDTLEALRHEGVIGAYGWSTDFPERLEAFAAMPGFVAVENNYNIFERAEALMDVARRENLVSLSRLPLAMGLLTGKYSVPVERNPSDIRRGDAEWMRYFYKGRPDAGYLEKLGAVRELLQTGGRTPAQGALCWILARAPHALPVPGFTTPEQVAENLGALEAGPLPASVMAEIETLLPA